MPGINAYRSWYTGTTQLNGGVDVVTPMKLTGELSNTGAGTITVTNQATNVSFTVQNSGTYEITFNVSAFCDTSDGLLNVWANVSGTRVANSNLLATCQNNHVLSIGNTFTTNLASSTPLTFSWLTDNAAVNLVATAAVVGKQPLTPSFLVSIKQLNSTFRPANVFYVSKDSPTNRWVDGGFEAPYTTVQAAINAANAIAASEGVQIISIAPGYYQEALTFTKGYVTLIGTATSQYSNSGVTIYAPTGSSHVINVTSVAFDNLYLNQISFANLTLAQSSLSTVALLRDISTRQHSVLFGKCQLSGRNVLFDNSSSASDMRTYVEDCEWAANGAGTGPLGSTDACFSHKCGTATLYRTNVSSGNNAPCILTANTGILYQAVLCNFANAANIASPAPLVRLGGDITFPQGFAQCLFTYTTAIAKTNPSSCGILLSGAGAQQVIMTDCLFFLLGTSAEGFAVHVEGAAVHQVFQSGSTAFNALIGGVSYPTARYINAPIAQWLPITPFLLGGGEAL